MKPASLTGVLIEKTLDLVYIFSKTRLLRVFQVPPRISAKKYFAEICGDIDEIKSKKHAEEKKKFKNCD